MGKYVYLNKEIDKEILIDWYINSTDEDTIWTEKHIDELLEDFVLIPKSSLTSIEEKTINDIKKSVKHGRWVRTDKSWGVETVYACSECNERQAYRENYCPNCGARMKGEQNEND